MAVIQLHRCKRCGDLWFPRTPETPKICCACEWERMEAEFQEHVKRLLQAGIETRLLFAFVVAFVVFTICVFLTDVWYDVHFLK